MKLKLELVVLKDQMASHPPTMRNQTTDFRNKLYKALTKNEFLFSQENIDPNEDLGVDLTFNADDIDVIICNPHPIQIDLLTRFNHPILPRIAELGAIEDLTVYYRLPLRGFVQVSDEEDLDEQHLLFGPKRAYYLISLVSFLFDNGISYFIEHSDIKLPEDVDDGSIYVYPSYEFVLYRKAKNDLSTLRSRLISVCYTLLTGKGIGYESGIILDHLLLGKPLNDVQMPNNKIIAFLRRFAQVTDLKELLNDSLFTGIDEIYHPFVESSGEISKISDQGFADTIGPMINRVLFRQPDLELRELFVIINTWYRCHPLVIKDPSNPLMEHHNNALTDDLLEIVLKSLVLEQGIDLTYNKNKIDIIMAQYGALFDNPFFDAAKDLAQLITTYKTIVFNPDYYVNIDINQWFALMKTNESAKNITIRQFFA